MFLSAPRGVVSGDCCLVIVLDYFKLGALSSIVNRGFLPFFAIFETAAFLAELMRLFSYFCFFFYWSSSKILTLLERRDTFAEALTTTSYLFSGTLFWCFILWGSACEDDPTRAIDLALTSSAFICVLCLINLRLWCIFSKLRLLSALPTNDVSSSIPSIFALADLLKDYMALPFLL